MKLFITANIHGNQALIHAIGDMAKATNIDALVIVGNIAPRKLYQFFEIGSKLELYTNNRLEAQQAILVGGEQQARSVLDLLGFVDVGGANADSAFKTILQQKKVDEICHLLQMINIPVYILTDSCNHIKDEVLQHLMCKYGLHNLNFNTYNLHGLKITGFPSDLASIQHAANERSEIKLAQELKCLDDKIDSNTILVTLCSPKGILESNTNCDKNGSLSLLNFIQRQQPTCHVFASDIASCATCIVDSMQYCNISNLWTDSILRGAMIDTDTREIELVEQNISLDKLIASMK